MFKIQLININGLRGGGGREAKWRERESERGEGEKTGTDIKRTGRETDNEETDMKRE